MALDLPRDGSVIGAGVRRRVPAVVCLLALGLGGCTSQDAQALKDQAAEAVSAAEGFDVAALEELVAAGNAELQATTTELRRRLKRMEARLTALEEDLDAVAAAAADAEAVAGVEASTGELAEQVQTLSAELDRLTSEGASTGGGALLDPDACVASGGEWNAVLASCAR